MPVNQESWDARLALAVGRNLRAIREGLAKPLSASALSERTRMLGHPVHRSVIAKLENGERASVTLADLFVLAHALDVPPLALLAPLASGEPVEVLPGKFWSSWAALDWFTGIVPTPGADEAQQAGAYGEAWENITRAYELRREYLSAYDNLMTAVALIDQIPEGPARIATLQHLSSEAQNVNRIGQELTRLGVAGVPHAVDPAAVFK